MWFNIIPSFSVILAGVAVPGYALWWAHWLVNNGNHFRRSMIDRWDRRAYQRDMRITGNPYVQASLDSIPDED